MRRLVLYLLVLFVGLIVAWGAWSAKTVMAAARDADAGRAAIDGARGASSPADIVAGRPLPDLRRARSLFLRAHKRLSSPLLTPARILPFIGRQIRSADAITGGAGTVSDVAISSITEGKTILTLPRRTGLDRVALLRRTASLAERAERQIAVVDLGPTHGLIGRLSRARTEFGDELASLRATLRAASSGAHAAADLLDGPRKTLVFAANNAEMRAGSGMFLVVGELATSRGALSLDPMISVAQVPIPRGIPVEGDLKARWGWANPSRDWTSLMMSPDFSTSAQLAARMWKAARKSTVDGLISIDPAGLRALLSATGPVTIAGRRITASNVEQELLHDQYERFPTRETAARHESLAQIPGAVMSALNAGRWDPATLMSALAAAARGRHVMLWSARKSEEAAWRAAGVAGRLGESSLMVSVLNRGANKLDWFLQVDATLEFARGAVGTEGVVRITLKNATPRGEPSYIAGPGGIDTGGKEGDYVGILAVNLPGFSGGGRIDGVRALGIVGADGPTRVVGIPFILARGSTKVFVVRFQLADRRGEIKVEPSARIPTIRWASGADHWQDDSARVVSWSLGRSSH